MTDALRANEDRYRVLYEQTPSMYFTVDGEGTVLSVNQFGAQQLGYEPHELIGKTVLGVFHDDDKDSARAHLETCLARPDEVHRWELRKVCKNGLEMRVKETARAIVGPEGNTLILVVCEDITAHWRTDEALRIVSERTAPELGVDFFESLVRHLAEALRVRFAFISELLPHDPQRLRTLAWWAGTKHGENLEYAMAGTPCAEVFAQDGAYYPSGLRQRFPSDLWLVSQGIESYLAVPLYDRGKHAIGHLGVMHDGPMNDDLPRAEILRILAARAAAELERTRAEDALRQSETRFRDYFKFKSIGIATSSADKKWIDVNDELCRLLGYSRDELLGRSWVDLTHPDDRAANMDLFDQAEKGELEGYTIDKRFIRKDGSPIDIGLSVRCVRAPSGEIEYFLGVYQDVSRRKAAELALRESEEHFRNLVEGSIAGILIHRDWKPLFVNQAFAEIHGYESADEILALESIGRLLAPNEHARLRNYRNARLKGEPAPAHYEYEGLRKDGTTVALRNLVRVVNWQGDVALQNTVMDVTEWHESELALRDSEARFRGLFEQSNDAVIIHTADGKILDANHRACEMLGYDASALMHASILSLFPYSERDAAAAALQLKGDRASVQLESRFASADGREIDVEISARIVDAKEGIVQALVRDITVRRRHVEALRRYERMVSGTSDLMAFIDGNYTYQTANTAYLSAFGLAIENIVGQHVATVWGAEEFESGIKFQLDRCLAGSHVHHEHWMVLPAHGRRCLDVHYDPYFGEDGKVSGVVATLRDITDVKKTDTKLHEYQDQLRTLASEISLAEERQRRRIAVELHDRTIQSLALSRIKLGALREALAEEVDRTALEDIRALIDQTISDTRTLVFELSPPVLYELGFEPAIEWLVERLQEDYGIVARVAAEGQVNMLDRNLQIVLFQAVRELLANVAKHAHATEATVSIAAREDHVVIGVVDNGVGFDPSTTGTLTSKGTKFGLFSIRERLDLLGGWLTIDSRPGSGTRVTLTAPYSMNAESPGC